MQQLNARAQSIVAELREDLQSGATELARKTLDQVLAYLDHEQPDAGTLRTLLSELRQARPSMIVIGNALARIEQRGSAEPHAAREAILEIRAQLRDATSAMARHAREELPDTPVIMTHSASSAVLALFRSLAKDKKRFSVICTQSSPGFEGHTLARTLDGLSVPVTLITDAQMALFVGQADVVVTGCDTWFTDGWFINKSGTHLLALAARASGTPFWVLADSFRNSDANPANVILEEMSGDELRAPSGRWITPRNVYFELTPRGLVSRRISEQGVSSCPAGPRP